MASREEALGVPEVLCYVEVEPPIWPYTMAGEAIAKGWRWYTRSWRCSKGRVRRTHELGKEMEDRTPPLEESSADLKLEAVAVCPFGINEPRNIRRSITF